MLKPTRRVISGVDKNQQSTIIADEKVATLTPYEIFPCFQLQNLFYTENNPQSLQTRHEDKPYDINLPQGAFRFMTIRMPTIDEMAKEMRAAGQEVPTDWTKFNLHSTDSADYIYILSGEINYVVGDKTTQLKQGDFLAQIGPEHTWVNDGNAPCMVLCIMIGVKPKRPMGLMRGKIHIGEDFNEPLPPDVLAAFEGK